MNRTTGFGGSLFLIAAGAVMAFAVSVEASGFSINTIGYILMGVGVLGVVLTLITQTATKKEEHTQVIKKEPEVDASESTVSRDV